MSDLVTTQPPTESEYVWIREDHILDSLQRALNEAVETHGNKAKSIAWDMRSAFTKHLRGQQ